MITITLRENVVSDDVVHLADQGKVFTGQYVAILEYNTYLNAWNDKKHYRRFRTLDALCKYLDKNYKDFQGSIYDYLAV